MSNYDLHEEAVEDVEGDPALGLDGPLDLRAVEAAAELDQVTILL